MKKISKNNTLNKSIIDSKSATLIAVLLIVISVSLPSIRGSIYDAISAIYGSVLVALTNKDRAGRGLAELKNNEFLEKAAQMKADDMAEKGYFSHNTPDGKNPWYWFDKAGYKYSYAGENLAVNFNESQDIHDAWIRSELHKANIFNRNYTEIGIATSTGVYKGKHAIFVVQLFGKPQK